MTTAERLCREQGWAVGDTLEGEIAGRTARIRITAIGGSVLVARRPGAAETLFLVRELVSAEFRKVAP